MKKIGMIGGMSWESTLLYYQLINTKVKEIKGGFHSAACVIESVDFSEIAKLQSQDDWMSLNKVMIERAQSLESSGAQIILICANTMHLCVEAIEENITAPVLHIARATAEEITKLKLNKVALLGTRFTMEKDFFKDILKKEYQIDVLVPDQEDREMIHQVIYEELVLGSIQDESREKYLRVIDKLISDGAQGVILGCTEIPLLISQADVEIPLFNTTQIHADRAVEIALE
jgi:aspartate racemase